MPAPIRVILAEDHQIVREGLRALLSAAADIEVVAEAIDGLQAVAACRQHQPDVAVMDVGLPRRNGIAATRVVQTEMPDIRVLMLSMHDSAAHVQAAFDAGARGYLLKGSGIADLVAAIRTVAGGGRFVSPELAKLEQTVRPQLTPRERDVLIRVAEGDSSAEIAERLGLSIKTVEGHRGRLMTKLGAKNVAGLVRYALESGLIES